jgi:hypothetical protein
MDSSTYSNEFDDLVEECFGPLLKEGTLQYIEKELIGREDNIGLVVIRRSSLTELYSKKEYFRIGEQYNRFDKLFDLNLTYSYVLFVIVFCPVEEFNKIFSEVPLKSQPLDYGRFLWGTTETDTKIVESLKTFLYPISIKPAKRN